MDRNDWPFIVLYLMGIIASVLIWAWIAHIDSECRNQGGVLVRSAFSYSYECIKR